MQRTTINRGPTGPFAAAAVLLAGAAAAPTAHAQCPVSFAPAVNYAAGGSSQAVTVGDFNADGRPDLAVANQGSSGNVFILLGNPGGTFQSAGSYTVGGGPWSVAVGDFNADGRADLAVAKDNGAVSILLGNGNGTFQAAVNYPVLAYAYFVAVSDFNADGRSDLVVTGSSDPEHVFILLGNGNGTFQPAVGYPTTGSNQFWQVGIGDFNADGSADLAVTNEDANGVFVLLGNGNGTFQAAAFYFAGAEPTSIVVSDFDADGDLDLTVGYQSGPAQGSVAILLGNGNGTFQAAVSFTFPAGNGHVRIAVGDFNADGRPDLAAGGFYGRVSILLGNGNGTFQAAVIFAVGLDYPRGVAVGDFNADGQVDVAATFIDGNSNGSVSVLLNTSACSPCYPNCDGSSGSLLLNVNDFVCFSQRFAGGDPYADCNRDSSFNVSDFVCFQGAFAAGCP